jgi:rhamnose utilization protein RhaD (predicted bifunctional aldolase and dehydrogenase)
MLTPLADSAALRDLSARIGAEPLLIQGAGGNTSVKQGAVMWIKASGTQLSEAQSRDIFVPVDLLAMRASVAAGESRADQPDAFALTQALRPSIETALHAVFSQRVVVHVHCIQTIAWMIQPDVKAQLAQRLRGFHWAQVPYARPGAKLAGLVMAALAPQTDVVLLGNHGLLVAAETVAAAEALLRQVVAALDLAPRAAQSPDLALLHARAGLGFVPLPPEHPAHQIALHADLMQAALLGSLYPDHVIFLGIGATELWPHETQSDAVQRREKAGLTPPVFLLLAGAGALMRADASAAAHALLRCLGEVLLRLPQGAVPRALSIDENAELLDWDAEKYRQALDDA